MSDSEYLVRAERTLDEIEQAIDRCGADIDSERSGNVLTLEFADGGKIIINLQEVMQEIWVAAKPGAFHYRYRDGVWRAPIPVSAPVV